MRAAVCTAYGSPEVIQVVSIPIPQIQANEALINIKASTVNSGDIRTRGLIVDTWMKPIMRLVLGIRKPRKPILGTTFAGEVVALGKDVTKFKVGDRLFGMTGFQFGTHSQYICLKENALMLPMPSNASFEAAAALPFGAHTSIYLLEKAGIQKYDKPMVLIYGATGAVGMAAVQIAQYFNAQVTAVCSSGGQTYLEELGVQDIICYDKNDVRKLNQKFDIVFDAVGKIKKQDFKHLLREKGKFVTVGGLSIVKEKIQQIDLVKQLFEAGKYKACIDKIYVLEDILAAHAYVDTGRKKGNVVIRM